MKALNQYNRNVRIFMFHSFRLCCSPNRNAILENPCITTTQEHWEEHDLIVYFYFQKMTKTEVFNV